MRAKQLPLAIEGALPVLIVIVPVVSDPLTDIDPPEPSSALEVIDRFGDEPVKLMWFGISSTALPLMISLLTVICDAVTVPLKDVGSFGNYTVVATFSYGKDNQTIEVTKSFWVVPVFVIVIAIAGTIGLIVLIVGIWLFLRNYKRRILKSHGRRSGGYRR